MSATQTLTLPATEDNNGKHPHSLDASLSAVRCLTTEVARTGKKRKRGDVNTAASLALSDTGTSPTEEVVGRDSAGVLSHAEARKRRKQDAESMTAPDGVPSTSPKKTKARGLRKDKSAPTKRQNSVWIGNLSFQTTQDRIKQFFQPAGEVTRTHMPMRIDGGKLVNRGFAYVDFATAEGKIEAITYSERGIDGRRVLIKDGEDFTGRPASTVAGQTTENSPSIEARPSGGLSRFAQKVLKHQKQPPAPTLFIGNLSFEATADSIRAMIEAHEKARNAKALARMKNAKRLAKQLSTSEEDSASSEEQSEEQNEPSLVKVRVGTFEDSGNCKGFAFLDFRDTQLATAALIDPRNYSMDGREVKLEYAGTDAVRRSGLHHNAAGNLARAPKTNTTGRKSGTKSSLLGENVTHGQDREEIPPPLPMHSGVPKEKVSVGKHHRPRPGAALASAPRGQASIVPSQGKKITF